MRYRVFIVLVSVFTAINAPRAQIFKDTTQSAVGATGTSLYPLTAPNYVSLAPAGSNGFACSVNGCRFDFGAGASDYASSDGTTVTFAGPLAGTSFTATAASGAN